MVGLTRQATGLHSHNASNTGSRPWSGGVYLVWRHPICASFGVHSLFIQQAGLLSVAIWVVPFARFVTIMQTVNFQDKC